MFLRSIKVKGVKEERSKRGKEVRWEVIREGKPKKIEKRGGKKNR